MERILNYLNNFFYRWGEKGAFTITDNKLNVEHELMGGQYIKINGSVLNDGVHKVLSYRDGFATLEGLENEEFEGLVLSLAVPRTLNSLPKKIDEFELKNPVTALASESFGNYSYSNATNESGGRVSWQDVFASDLKLYRKMNDNLKHVRIFDKVVK